MFFPNSSRGDVIRACGSARAGRGCGGRRCWVRTCDGAALGSARAITSSIGSVSLRIYSEVGAKRVGGAAGVPRKVAGLMLYEDAPPLPLGNSGPALTGCSNQHTREDDSPADESREGRNLRDRRNHGPEERRAYGLTKDGQVDDES